MVVEFPSADVTMAKPIMTGELGATFTSLLAIHAPSPEKVFDKSADGEVMC